MRARAVVISLLRPAEMGFIARPRTIRKHDKIILNVRERGTKSLRATVGSGLISETTSFSRAKRSTRPVNVTRIHAAYCTAHTHNIDRPARRDILLRAFLFPSPEKIGSRPVTVRDVGPLVPCCWRVSKFVLTAAKWTCANRTCRQSAGNTKSAALSATGFPDRSNRPGVSRFQKYPEMNRDDLRRDNLPQTKT